MKINIPKECNTIMNLLENNGFDAYVVGGCVRDSLLGLIPKDWDITTNATPMEIKRTFEKINSYSVIPTGEKYGTITIYCKENAEAYEITTYRLDGNYSDGRRPDSVLFSDNIADDLARRDFTINAIAYNPKKGIKDFHEGQNHLENKKLCLVGEPKERLREDGLRIMRAIRFSYKLKLNIEQKTFDAIYEAIDMGYLDYISKKRIHDELIQILEYFYYEDVTYQLFEKILFSIIPELKPMKGFNQLNPHHIFNLWDYTKISMINTPANHILRLTMLLHDIGKLETFKIDDKGVGHFYGHAKQSVIIVAKILDRLKFDNKEKEKILKLIEYHDIPFMCSKKAIKQVLLRLSEEEFILLSDVRFADATAHNPVYIYNSYTKIQTEKDLLSLILKEKECFSLKDLSIKGKDLIDIGLKGVEVGKWLKECLELVIDNNTLNDKETLLNYVRNKIK